MLSDCQVCGSGIPDVALPGQGNRLRIQVADVPVCGGESGVPKLLLHDMLWMAFVGQLEGVRVSQFVRSDRSPRFDYQGG